MTVSRFSRQKPIPSLSTRKSAPTTTNFAKGIYTYKPNDAMDYDEASLAQNARFERIGEYATRLGLIKLCEPVGKTTTVNNYSGNYDMVPTTEFSYAVPNSALASGHGLYSINLTVAAENDSYGVLQAILTDSATGKICRSCTANLGTTPEDVEFIFKDAPTGTLTLTLAPQSINGASYRAAVLAGTTTPMVKVNTAPTGKVTNVFELNVNGTYTTLFTFRTSAGITTLYRAAANGQVNLIRQLPSGVTKVRFSQNINKIRYADGVEGPRIIDPASSWSDSAIPTTDLPTGTNLNIHVSNILEGTQDNMMYFNADTDTAVLWTYPYGYRNNGTPVNSYDKFSSTFYQNFPAIETGDPLTAMFNLGGIIYVMTARNKYYMYSQTADVWTQQAASAQHGTFSQESVVCDLNYAYYANSDGVYVFDGSSESSLTEKTIQNAYDAILGKESITLELYNNRLYVFYSSNGDGANDSCLVYNTNLRVWESFDTGVCVSASSGRRSPSNRLICGSSRFCQLFLWESATGNDFSDVGAPIDFDLETSYMTFGTPSQLHRITKWRPEFATTAAPYTIKCGFATDFTDDVKYAYSINLLNAMPLNEHYIWDNPPSYGNAPTPTKLTTIPKVYGQFRRCQLRYQHHAAFEPVNFKSHTVTVQTERIR